MTTILNASIHACTYFKTFIYIHFNIHLHIRTTKSAIIANSCILINVGYCYIIICFICTSREIRIDIILRSTYPDIIFPVPSLIFSVCTTHPFFIFFFTITTRIIITPRKCFCSYICMNIIFYISGANIFGVFLPAIIGVNRNCIFRITATFLCSNNYYSIRSTYTIQSS